MTRPLALQLSAWPEIDQIRWREARTVTSFLTGPRPASRWSDRRCRIVEQAYGQWLAYLLSTGQLDQKASPASRVQPEILRQFITILSARVAPWSVAMMVQALRTMLMALDPEAVDPISSKLVANLKRAAKPTRDKRAHMVSPSDLFALGMSLVAQANQESEALQSATKARDGVMIALLACCPIRIANLTQIDIGQHLRFDCDRYVLTFSQTETKTGQPFEAELPPEMTPVIDNYLRHTRRYLLERGEPGQTRALWIDRWGRRLQEHSIRAQIETRTCAAFGRHVWPHLFRTIAATGFVDLAPEQIRLLPDLLGHTDAQTTHRYYVLADAMRAHGAVQNALMRERAEALARRSAQKSGSSS